MAIPQCCFYITHGAFSKNGFDLSVHALTWTDIVDSTSSRLASLGQLMKYGTTKSVVRSSTVSNHGFGKVDTLCRLSVFTP